MVHTHTLDPPQADRSRREAPRRRNAVRGAMSLAFAAVLLGFVLPRAVGGGWGAITAALSGVSPLTLGGFAVVWFAGLLAHMFVLTAGLPGLTVRRALLMSLTGSSVSNVLPMGGAAGTALNYSMCRRWGHSRSAFVLFTVVTHLWGVVAKLLLPVLALAALMLTGGSSAQLLVPTVIAASALLGLVTLVAVVLSSEGAAAAVGRAGERAIAGAGRFARRPWQVSLEGPARELRAEAVSLTRRNWRRPALGMLGYIALQALLLWLCLHALGSVVGPVQVFAAYAIERLLTIVVLTPGGLGVVEVTMTAMLVAFGASPVTATAGVLLYRAFTYALEIPVGGALLLGWWGLRQAQDPTWTAPGPEPEGSALAPAVATLGGVVGAPTVTAVLAGAAA